MSGFTPVNQVRLTNVAAVKLQKKGKRFEIACYRNKVLSWRNKLETDIREVLQIDTVFTNVSKGMLANAKDLQDAFGTTDQKLVCQEILEKGEIQVSEQERGALYETIFRDIASIVADKTINPQNNRPYTIAMIQNAMRQIQYSVNMSKSSKSQALDVIRKLRDVMPIARASMLIRIVCATADVAAFAEEIEKLAGVIVSPAKPKDGDNDNKQVEAFIDVKLDPEHFRRIEELAKTVGDGHSRVEVLQLRMASTTGVHGGATEHKEAEPEPVETEVSQQTTSKSKKGVNKTSKREEELARKEKNDLSALLSEVTGRADIADGSDDEEEDIPTMVVTKKNKKNKKNKDKATTSSSVTIKEHDDDEDDEEEDEDMAETSSRMSSEVSATQQPSNSVPAAALKPKGSKKEKRSEKEEKREKEAQAKLLQERIKAEKQKKADAIAVAAAIAVDSDAVAESSAAAAATPVAAAVESPVLDSSSSASASAGSKAQSCNTCGGSFPDLKAYREHFKSEWHRFNLKRKMKNLPVITSEEEFLSLSVDQLQI